MFNYGVSELCKEIKALLLLISYFPIQYCQNFDLIFSEFSKLEIRYDNSQLLICRHLI